VVLAAAMLTSCVQADPVVTVRFQLDVPERLDVEAPLRDTLGLFNLESWPLFVALRIQAPDMEPLQAQWPDAPEDWVDGSTEVEFALEVPAGKSRTVSAVAFRRSGDKTYCYVTPPPKTVIDLDNDSPAGLDLLLEEAAYGTASIALPPGIAELGLFDSAELVQIDSRIPIEDFVKFPRVPLGRPMQLMTVSAKSGAEVLDVAPFTVDAATPDLSLDLSNSLH